MPAYFLHHHQINYFSIFSANSLQEVNNHLFSVLQWIGINNIEQWFAYPLGILNVFEVIYWILLAIFFANYVKKPVRTALGFVAKTYGAGLLLWTVFIVYINLFLF